jgi:hypothetical protein
VLGRARQRTLVVDAGGQSNRDAHGIGGLLGHDGRPPAAFYSAGRDELAAYPTVELRSGEVLGGERHDAGFVLELGDGAREAARRVLLATGMDYRFPTLPGIAQRWGRSVFHCPFCHGWEVRDLPLGVLDRGASGVQRALLLCVWSDEVTLLADGPAELDAEDVERLRAAGVTAEGEPARPARPLAVPQPRKAFFDKALAPLRHRVDRHPKPPGDRDVLLAIGGQHDPGPDDLALLGRRPAQPSLQHSPLAGGQETANGLGRLTSG